MAKIEKVKYTCINIGMARFLFIFFGVIVMSHQTGCKLSKNDKSWGKLRNLKVVPFKKDVVLSYREIASDSLVFISCRTSLARDSNFTTYLSHAKRPDGLIHPKYQEDTDSTYQFGYISNRGTGLRLIDSTIKYVIRPYGRERVVSGGIDLSASINDTMSIKIFPCRLILEEKGIWNKHAPYYVFREWELKCKKVRRTMYVHNIGFIWEEITSSNMTYHWKLESIDGIPLLEYLEQDPGFKFFE